MSDDVIAQLAAVRETGAVNMLDRYGVQRVAEQCGFQELVAFIDDASSQEYIERLEEMGRRR